MREKYADAMIALIEITDEYVAELVVDLISTKTADGVCPKKFAEVAKKCGYIGDILETIVHLDTLKTSHGHVDATHNEGVTFGRTRR